MRQINPGRIGRLLTGQLVIGAVDGVNATFTTARPFLHSSDFEELVYLRGVRRFEGVGCDYVAAESGGPGTGFDTITFQKAPKVGNNILIDYYPAG